MAENENLKEYYEKRNYWLQCSDEELFKLCKCDFFKSTGRGGQKRNKTSSAVRLTHIETEISATADDFRSQHDNRKLALKRLRIELAMQCRSKELPKVNLKNSKKKSAILLANCTIV